MAFIYGDRVKETSLTVGAGTMALGGATAGFQSFSVGIGLGNETFYGIVNTVDNAWEMGRGTAGVGTLSRDTVFSSSNSNNLVSFAVGDKIVYTTGPAEFFAGALDSTSHELEDHTVAPLDLLDAIAHEAVDHTAAPLNLLTDPAHQAVDHTVAPFNLLNATSHELVDHTAAPFNLLNVTSHEQVDHMGGPLFLLDTGGHNSLNHALVPNINYDQISGPERAAGTSLALRSFSPDDIKVMAADFGGGSGAAALKVATFPPSQFSWVASGAAIATGAILSGGLPFTPTVAFAFGAFHHNFNVTTAINWSTLSIGAATSSAAFSHGQNCEDGTDGNQDATTAVTGSIAGVLASSSSPATALKSIWDLASVNVGWDTPSGQITLTPSVPITGNVTLIVMG